MALPISAAGISASRQFWAAVATSLPQPIGAMIAFVLVEQVSALLAVSFSFAAGAILVLVVIELLPSAVGLGQAPPRPGAPHAAWVQALLGLLAGAAVMIALSWALGV